MFKWRRTSNDQPRPRRRARPGLLVVGWSYAGLIACWLLLRGLFFDQLWWLALLNTDALVLFLPLVLLLPLALWPRPGRLLLALTLPIAAGAGLVGDLLLPPLSPAPSGPSITVMSFNVLWSNVDYPRIAQAIRAAEADVVALQELRPGHLPALSAALSDRLPYQTNHPADQYHSVGLLSRFPIETVTALPEPPLARALMVRLRVGDRSLTVIAAHLTPTNMLDHGLAEVPATVTARFASRAAEVRALLSTVQTVGSPAIILCDCNFTDTSEAYSLMRSGLQDSVAATGWGLRRTMLAPVLAWPAQRLDYVWYTPDLTAVAAVVGADGGSDHLPVVARLVWPAGR